MTEKEVREKLHKVLDLVIDINGVEPRKQEVSVDLPTAFLWFCGHVAEIDISVCTKGWDPETLPDVRHSYYFNDLDKAIKDLEVIKNALRSGNSERAM